MSEETGGRGLTEVKRVQKREKTKIGKLAGFLETIEGLVSTKDRVAFAVSIVFNERELREGRR
jgi:hypothetical protein